ncbi:unnamed protein product [Rotaria magnacalcarata]|uniref:Uncharacterized protein n=2 Tax=Rotaria magnacalcarata TaxID=392030 RepID=A0A8S3EI92_9BILA|nr:unnamed protein product [Rotaria magnacalcarata]
MGNETNVEYIHSINQLKRIVNTVNIFIDSDKCVDFLTEINELKVLMIVFNVLGERLVPFIHDFSQIEAIYIVSFMYTQLLKEILLELNYTEQPIREFTDCCCAQQENYSLNLTVIEEFQQKYSPETAIWWYSSAFFIYEMVNHAPRTQEVNTT